MQTDEGIQDQEPRPVATDRLGEPTLVAIGVEPKSVLHDEMERKGLEILSAMRAEAFEAIAHSGRVVLRGEDEDGPRNRDLVLAERRGTTGDAEGEIESEPALAAFGLATHDPDSARMDFDTSARAAEDFNSGWLAAARVDRATLWSPVASGDTNLMPLTHSRQSGLRRAKPSGFCEGYLGPCIRQFPASA